MIIGGGGGWSPPDDDDESGRLWLFSVEQVAPILFHLLRHGIPAREIHITRPERRRCVAVADADLTRVLKLYDISPEQAVPDPRPTDVMGAVLLKLDLGMVSSTASALARLAEDATSTPGSRPTKPRRVSAVVPWPGTLIYEGPKVTPDLRERFIDRTTGRLKHDLERRRSETDHALRKATNEMVAAERLRNLTLEALGIAEEVRTAARARLADQIETLLDHGVQIEQLPVKGSQDVVSFAFDTSKGRLRLILNPAVAPKLVGSDSVAMDLPPDIYVAVVSMIARQEFGNAVDIIGSHFLEESHE